MKITWLLLMLMIVAFSSRVMPSQYDPMAPPGYGNVISEKPKKIEKRKEHYHLRQILVRENGNRAVINGYVLKEGEYINRAKIISIETNKVTLSKAGKISVIKLHDPVKKVRQ